MNASLYEQQLAEKKQRLSSLFAEFSPPALDVFPSPLAHYRMRAEFRVWHEGEDLYYYMFDKEKDQKVRTDQFLPASLLINQMMEALMQELRPNKILRHKLFQIDFLSTVSGEILVSLLYHRPLGEEWTLEAAKLKTRLSSMFNVNLIGRARKQKIVLDCDYVIEKLQVKGKELIYKQVENSFTQPNATVAVKMLEWAMDVTQNSRGDLLELYCGNGNFSIALASNFRKVLATELAAPSVEAAQFNIKENQVKNLQIIRMSAEDFSGALKGTREFNRLKGIDLKEYDCETIFVDPPRAGLDEKTLGLVQQYPIIVYISCNPQTLKENLKVLTQTHQIERWALFDQFPYTEHMEAGVYLKRRA